MKKLPLDYISENSHDDTIDRRGFLKCMAWAGTGVIWSINGGILTSTVLGQAANSASQIATAELNFVQISDSHIGFNKPANTDVVGTTREAIMLINALPKPPEFLLHTGDLTHLTEPEQFDTLAQVMKECKIKDVFYVPGEHDYLRWRCTIPGTIRKKYDRDWMAQLRPKRSTLHRVGQRGKYPGGRPGYAWPGTN
jgi:3',5'-cyclic-AMP phosphodiesterase